MSNNINFVFWKRELEKTTGPLDVDFLQRAKKVLNSGNSVVGDDVKTVFTLTQSPSKTVGLAVI